MTKHMFAGTNTPMGFVNFFDHIMPLEKAKKRIFLKGSSGSGKSTFIKKIAAEFEALGVDTERFHCSNDPESLDALAVASRGLCIIDATAPHSRDPEIPGAIDKIVDFAEFLDERKLRRYVNEIKSLTCMKKQLNEKASAYLAAAGEIYLAENKSGGSFNEKLLRCKKKSLGIDRKLFLSAVTSNGFVSFAESYFDSCKIQNSGGLTELRDIANSRGINTESFHCPFAPQRLEYLHLPALGKIFAEKWIKNALFDKMLNAVVELMRESMTHHTKIEEIYASAMNFEKVGKLTDKIANEFAQMFNNT